jgi:hypothetical protein
MPSQPYIHPRWRFPFDLSLFRFPYLTCPPFAFQIVLVLVVVLVLEAIVPPFAVQRSESVKI